MVVSMLIFLFHDPILSWIFHMAHDEITILNLCYGFLF